MHTRSSKTSSLGALGLRRACVRSKLCDIAKIELLKMSICAVPAWPPHRNTSYVKGRSRLGKATIGEGVRLLRRIVCDGLSRNNNRLISATSDQVAEGVGSTAIKTSIVA